MRVHGYGNMRLSTYQTSPGQRRVCLIDDRFHVFLKVWRLLLPACHSGDGVHCGTDVVQRFSLPSMCQYNRTTTKHAGAMRAAYPRFKFLTVTVELVMCYPAAPAKLASNASPG